MSDKIWRLYNASTQRQIVDLDLEGARQLYARMAPAETAHWFAWQQGWLDWLRVTDVPELQVAPAQSAAPRITPPPPPAMSTPSSAIPPPSTKRKTASGVTLEAVAEASATSEAPKARPTPPVKAAEESFVERRKYPRVDLKLKVIIEVADRVFRTFSKDVSLGGLQLQERIPWEMQSDSCKVYLSSPDGRDSIEFNSRIVVDLKNPKRVQFVDAPNVYLDKLNAWIDAHNKKARKAA